MRESVATKADIAALRAKIDLAVRDITIRTGGMLIAGAAFLAALKFFR